MPCSGLHLILHYIFHIDRYLLSLELVWHKLQVAQTSSYLPRRRCLRLVTMHSHLFEKLCSCRLKFRDCLRPRYFLLEHFTKPNEPRQRLTPLAHLWRHSESFHVFCHAKYLRHLISEIGSHHLYWCQRDQVQVCTIAGWSHYFLDQSWQSRPIQAFSCFHSGSASFGPDQRAALLASYFRKSTNCHFLCSWHCLA